jgi:hypothetical protein
MPKMKAAEFLARYGESIRALPALGKGSSLNLTDLSAEEYTILTTLLPAAAAIKRRRPDLKTAEIIEETKDYCVREINGVSG